MGRRLVVLLSVAVLALIAAVASAGATAIPLPSADPFYTPPAGYASQPDGAVLAARPITATLLSVPLSAHAWQILFRSSDSHGQPTAEVATVMVPDRGVDGHRPAPGRLLPDG